MNQKNTTSRALALIDPRGADHSAQKSRGADVIGIIEEHHDKYRIKAGRLGGTYVARAFPKPPSKAQGMFAQAEGDSYQAAIAALRSVIEARDIQRKSVRRWDEDASVSVPNEDEYIEALYQTALSRPQIAMLKAMNATNKKLAGQALIVQTYCQSILVQPHVDFSEIPGMQQFEKSINDAIAERSCAFGIV